MSLLFYFKKFEDRYVRKYKFKLVLSQFYDTSHLSYTVRVDGDISNDDGGT